MSPGPGPGAGAQQGLGGLRVARETGEEGRLTPAELDRVLGDQAPSRVPSEPEPAHDGDPLTGELSSEELTVGDDGPTWGARIGGSTVALADHGQRAALAVQLGLACSAPTAQLIPPVAAMTVTVGSRTYPFPASADTWEVFEAVSALKPVIDEGKRTKPHDQRGGRHRT